jgi:hypothetical protein
VVGEIVLASKNEQSDDGLVNGGLRRSIVVAAPGGKHCTERVRQVTCVVAPIGRDLIVGGMLCAIVALSAVGRTRSFTSDHGARSNPDGSMSAGLVRPSVAMGSATYGDQSKPRVRGLSSMLTLTVAARTAAEKPKPRRSPRGPIPYKRSEQSEEVHSTCLS